MESGGIGINSELQQHKGLSVKIPQDLVKGFRTAQHIVVLTGAGISAESGILTFREAQTGLWAKYNPEELATPHAFKPNPKLVLEGYKWRRTIVNQASSNETPFSRTATFKLQGHSESELPNLIDTVWPEFE